MVTPYTSVSNVAECNKLGNAIGTPLRGTKLNPFYSLDLVGMSDMTLQIHGVCSRV